MLEQVAQDLVNFLQSEFDAQGHNATGAGSQSLEYITKKGATFNIQILGNDYLQYVNDGRQAGSLPPIQAIKEWVQIKGIASGKEAENAAWAISKAIEREGIPTSGAMKFSSNGRRTGFIDYIVEEKGDELTERMSQSIKRVLVDGINIS